MPAREESFFSNPARRSRSRVVCPLSLSRSLVYARARAHTHTESASPVSLFTRTHVCRGKNAVSLSLSPFLFGRKLHESDSDYLLTYLDPSQCLCVSVCVRAHGCTHHLHTVILSSTCLHVILGAHYCHSLGHGGHLLGLLS